MQYEGVFPIAGLTQDFQGTLGGVMIAAASPALVILMNPCLILFFSKFFKVETPIKEVTGIVAIRAVGMQLLSVPGRNGPGLWTGHLVFTVCVLGFSALKAWGCNNCLSFWLMSLENK